MINKEFYEAQKEMIDITLNVLKFELKKYKRDPRFQWLFYDNKDIPSHILQPLQSLKNKIMFKPVYTKIEQDLHLSHFKAKKLIENYWFSYILNHVEEIKAIQDKHSFNQIVRKLPELIKK